MSARQYRSKRTGRRSYRSWPWWLHLLLGVAAFAAFRVGLVRVLPASALPALADTATLGVLAWVLFGWFAALAARSAWRARQRHQWFRRMCDLAAIKRLDWRRFEQLVAEAFSRQGFTAQLTGQGGADGGVDVVLRRRGVTLLVQCKQWQSSSVGVKVVREMFGLMAAHGADGIVVVCTGGFTRDALDFAQGRPVDLVDGEQLVGLMREVL
ncbi:restriction endonuclease [Burkholderia sp. LMG 13014]|uniref:restriction endonuclease n=1 Tax=Burkholderia sp. LMG 13014 TaxID=2709306 RepID=UPI0019661ACA|nr:restriction endonuclease [Burkholderia sp. LMG 13014]